MMWRIRLFLLCQCINFASEIPHGWIGGHNVTYGTKNLKPSIIICSWFAQSLRQSSFPSRKYPICTDMMHQEEMNITVDPSRRRWLAAIGRVGRPLLPCARRCCGSLRWPSNFFCECSLLYVLLPDAGTYNTEMHILGMANGRPTIIFILL